MSILADLSSQVETAIDPMFDPEVQELNIEEIMMQEAWTGHIEHEIPEQTAVDQQLKEAIVGARDITDTVLENAEEAKSSIQRRMEGFEPLLDVSKVEEKEITEEQLQALQEKLDELKGASFGQNMKILSEIQEHSRPMEEVLQEVVAEQTVTQEAITEQTAVKEEVKQEVIPEKTTVKEEIIQEVIHEQPLVKEEIKQEVVPEQTTVIEEAIQNVMPEQKAVQGEVLREVTNEQTGYKEEEKSNPVHEAVAKHSAPETSQGPAEEITSVKKEAEKELDSTLAQVAKTINLEEANTSAVRDFDVELQAKPAITREDAEKVVITETPESSGTNVNTSSVENFIVPNAVGSGPAAAASISGAAIASASMAAASTVAAAVSPATTQSIEVEEKRNTAAPKPKLLGKKPLAKDKPKSTVRIHRVTLYVRTISFIFNPHLFNMFQYSVKIDVFTIKDKHYLFRNEY